MRKWIAFCFAALLLLTLVMLPAAAQRPPCGKWPDPPCRGVVKDATATAPNQNGSGLVTAAQFQPEPAPARSPLVALGLLSLGVAGYALVRRLRPKLPVQ